MANTKSLHINVTSNSSGEVFLDEDTNCIFSAIQVKESDFGSGIFVNNCCKEDFVEVFTALLFTVNEVISELHSKGVPFNYIYDLVNSVLANGKSENKATPTPIGEKETL